MDSTPFIMSRCLFDKPIWQNVLQFRLFFYLVAHAVYSPQGVMIGDILVKRGQVLKSYRTLQSELAYKENNAVKTYSLATLKRAVACLGTAKRLDVNITELGTLFTIVNYEQYQDLTQYKKKGVRNGAWNTNETPTKHQRNNNIKEIKEIKEIGKDLYMDFVLLSMEEYQKLNNSLGTQKTAEMIERLNSYGHQKQKKFKEYTSHYHTILSWIRKDGDNPKGKPKIPRGFQSIMDYVGSDKTD